MARPIVVYRKDENNVGDIASDPLQYFIPGQYDTIDILDLPIARWNSDQPIVVGGGGLLGNDFIGDNLYKLLSHNDYNQLANLVNNAWTASDPNHQDLQQKFMADLHSLVNSYKQKLATKVTAPRYIWGAGHNQDTTKRVKFIEYPSILSMFDKVAVRDYKQQYDYVPCASCMHPAFRKKYAIKNDIIWFEHKKQLVKSTEFATMSIPRFINSGANIEQVAELLGSANTIITNSYHGAYWGTLLKKKVIVVEAWSSKFYYLKHNPIFAPKGYFPVHELAEQCEIYPSAIDECVALNQKYFDEIRDTLK